MRSLSKREKIILIVCVGLVLVFAVRQLIIVPMGETAGNIDNQIKLTQAKLSKARQVLLLKNEVQERYKKLVDLVGVAESDAQEMSAMVDKVQAMANQSNVHIANIQPQRTIAKQAVSFFPIDLEINGQWRDIVQFINKLQSPPHNYFLNNLLMEKGVDPRAALNGRLTISRMKLIKP